MRIVTTCLLIAFTCLALSVSVSGVAKAEEKARKKPDPAKMFEKKDADGDGALTLDEFKKNKEEKLKNHSIRPKNLQKKITVASYQDF